jgi:predicted nuclease of restriction endonuclease-like RecB superfamily
MSGTTRQGNYLDNVFDTIRKNGLIEEYLYPDDANSWDEYYKELPQTLFDKAREFLKDWEIYREWVRVDRKEDIYTALKSSPLQVTVRYSEGNALHTVN